MPRFDLGAEALSGDCPGRIARQAERLGELGAEQGIAQGGEDKPQRALRDMMFLMADGQLLDQRPDRIEDRVQGIAIARQDHPGGEGSRAALAERIEGLVDDLPRVCLPVARALDGIRDLGRHLRTDVAGQSRLQARGRAKVMQEVGVGPADPPRHRLQGDRLWPRFKQQVARCFQRRGPALIRREAFTKFQAY